MAAWQRLAKRIRASLTSSTSSPRKSVDRSKSFSLSETACTMEDDVWIMVDVDKPVDDEAGKCFSSVPLYEKKTISRSFLVKDRFLAENKCAIFQKASEEQIAEDRFDTPGFDLSINNMILSRHNSSHWQLQLTDNTVEDQQKKILQAVVPFCKSFPFRTNPSLDELIANGFLVKVFTLNKRKQNFILNNTRIILHDLLNVATLAHIEITASPGDDFIEILNLLDQMGKDLGFTSLSELQL